MLSEHALSEHALSEHILLNVVLSCAAFDLTSSYERLYLTYRSNTRDYYYKKVLKNSVGYFLVYIASAATQDNGRIIYISPSKQSANY